MLANKKFKALVEFEGQDKKVNIKIEEVDTL
jgi:hypothetical protein